MELKQLLYFKTIVEEGTISAAARKLHISQPPLSNHIKLLEEELGVTLLVRGPRKVTPTDEGNILYKRAHDILKLSEATEKEIDQHRKGEAGVLHIGIVSTSGAIMLNPQVVAFHEAFPNIQFIMHEGNTFKQLDWVESGVVEIAIIRTPFPGDHLHRCLLREEPLVVLMDKKYDWCPGRNIIEVEELKNRPLLYHRRFENRIEDACRKAGFEPHNVCLSSDARTAVLWASSGMGIAIVPRITQSYCADASHMVIKELNCPDCNTQLYAVWHQDQFLTHAAQRFLECLSNKP